MYQKGDSLGGSLGHRAAPAILGCPAFPTKQVATPDGELPSAFEPARPEKRARAARRAPAGRAEGPRGARARAGVSGERRGGAGARGRAGAGPRARARAGRRASLSQLRGRRPGHVTAPAAAPTADAVPSPGHSSSSRRAAGSVYLSSSALHQHGLNYYSWKSPPFQEIR